ncbi:MAG: hypothetical protein ACREEE_07865 [Dongiaceae bacterium]
MAAISARIAFGLCGFLGLAIVAASIAQAEDSATVKAFATWQAKGQVFETGLGDLTFIGYLNGRLYIETEQGPLDSGQLVCPAVIKINAEDGSQQGSGACTVTARDGARAYATVTCTGFHLVGCDGDFKLTGGTGRFAGISGGSPVTIRSGIGEIKSASDSTATEEASGILYLRELTYHIP